MKLDETCLAVWIFANSTKVGIAMHGIMIVTYYYFLSHSIARKSREPNSKWYPFEIKDVSLLVFLTESIVTTTVIAYRDISTHDMRTVFTLFVCNSLRFKTLVISLLLYVLFILPKPRPRSDNDFEKKVGMGAVICLAASLFLECQATYPNYNQILSCVATVTFIQSLPKWPAIILRCIGRENDAQLEDDQFLRSFSICLNTMFLSILMNNTVIFILKNETMYE